MEGVLDIKSSEKQLKDSEKKLKTIIESSPDAIIVTDLEGKILECNQTALNITGFNSKKELIDFNVINFVCPEDKERIIQDIRKLILKNSLKNVEYKALNKKSQIVPIELSASVIFDDFHKPNAFVWVVKDITKHKKDEEAIKESEKRYRQIVETADEGIWEMDINFNTTHVNQKMTDMLGYSSEEMIKKPFTFFMFEEDLPDQELCVKRRKKGISDRYERRLKHKNGNEVWMSISATPLQDKHGKFAGSFAMFTDITKHKTAENALKESEQWFKNVVDTSPSLLVILNAEGKFVYVSPNAEELTGYTPEEIIEKNVWLVHPDELPRLQELFNKAFATRKGTKSIEYKSIKKNGEIGWTSITSKPIKNEKGQFKGFVVQLFDITKRKEAQNELNRRKKELETIMQGSPVLTFIIDKNHRVINWNKAIEEYSGLTAEEVIGTKNHWKAFYSKKRPLLADLMLENDIKGIIKWYHKCSKSRIVKGAYEIEDFFPTMGIISDRGKKGRWLRGTASIIKDEGGKIIGAMEILEDITERKKVEEALKSSEQNLRNIFDSSPIDIAIISLDNKIIDVNRAVLKLHGFSRKEEIIGKDMHSLVDKEYHKKVTEKWDEMLRTGYVNDIELVQLKKDGQKINTVISATLLNDDTGNPYAFLSMGQDITERKKAENELKKAINYNRGLIESNLDPLVTIGPDGKITDVNSATEDVTGYSREQLIGTDFSDYFTEPEKARKGYKNVFKDGIVRDYELEIKHKGGFTTPVSYNASVYKDGDNNVVGVFAAARDISERKISEKALKSAHDSLEIKVKERTRELEEAYDSLRESEEKFRELFNNANDTITLGELTEDGMPGKFIEVNDAAVQKLGYSRDELLNMTPLDLIQKNIEEGPQNALKILEDGNSRFETVHVAKDGSKIPVEVNTHLFKLKGKDVILGISRDITKRKKAEEKLKKSEAYYRTIFENTGTATFIIEEDSTISLKNEECERLIGYSKEEIENKMSWKNFVLPEYVPKMEKYHELRRINPELAPEKYEFEIMDKFGNIKNVYATIAMIPGTKKSVVSLLDTTDKKIAENALRESRAQLRIAMDLAKIVSWQYDVESDMFTFDDHFYRLYGTTAENEGGTLMSSEEYAKRFIPPEEAFLVAEETAKAIETDNPNFVENIEHSIIRADGEKRHIIVRYGIIKDDKGRTIKTYGANQDITELKEAQESLIKSRNYLDKIINSIADPILVKDEKHRWMLLNDSYCQFMGYSRKELLYKSDYDFFPSNEADVFWRKDEEVLKTGMENISEEEFTDSNNNVHIIVTKKTLYEDISGKKYIVGIIRDITELKKAEKELINSNKRFKAVMDSLDAIVYVSDMETYEILFLNKYGKKLWGDIEGKKCWKTIQNGQTGPCAFCTNERLLDENGNPKGVCIGEFKNTITKRWYECRDSAIMWIDGRLVRMEVATDITERKELENKSKERSRKLNILNEIILTANSSIDAQSLYKNVTDLALDLLNFNSGGMYIIDEDTGTSKIIYSKAVPEDLLKIIDNIRIDDYPQNNVFIEGKSSFIEEYDKIHPKISEIWGFKSMAMTPIFSKEKIIGSFSLASKNKHYFTKEEKELIKSMGREIGNTITRLITEEEMRQLIVDLKRSNDELERFAYVASHDLQEPLRTIASFTQLLEMRYKGKFDSDADEFMDYIVEAAKRMKEQIIGLLEYSRVAKADEKFQLVNGNYILENAINSLKTSIEEYNAKITYDELPSVMGNPNQLLRVFINLISNALKFRKEDESPKIHISARKDEEEIEYIFSVSDNGIGIEEQYMERIFVIFQRLHTREKYKGTGIGLSIVKKIIERHSGRIWVESEYGVGSTFYFTLPILD